MDENQLYILGRLFGNEKIVDYGEFWEKHKNFLHCEQGRVIAILNEFINSHYMEEKDDGYVVTPKGKDAYAKFKAAQIIELGRNEMKNQILENQLGITSFQNKKWFKTITVASIVIGLFGGSLGMYTFFKDNEPVPDANIVTKEYLEDFHDSTQMDLLEHLYSDELIRNEMPLIINPADTIKK